MKSSYFIEFVQDILYMYKVFEYYFLRAIMCISHISLFDSEVLDNINFHYIYIVICLISCTTFY